MNIGIPSDLTFYKLLQDQGSAIAGILAVLAGWLAYSAGRRQALPLSRNSRAVPAFEYCGSHFHPRNLPHDNFLIMRETRGREEVMAPEPDASDPGRLPALPPAADVPHLVPPLIVAAGDQAAWRYIDFFTANIRNPNTRRAYARACSTFFDWCGERGRTLGTIRPYDVST